MKKLQSIFIFIVIISNLVMQGSVQGPDNSRLSSLCNSPKAKICLMATALGTGTSLCIGGAITQNPYLLCSGIGLLVSDMVYLACKGWTCRTEDDVRDRLSDYYVRYSESFHSDNDSSIPNTLIDRDEL